MPHSRAELARWLLVLHLALSPLVFCVHTAEAFEENKVAYLKLIAWTLAGIGLSALVGARGPRQTVADLIGRDLIGAGVVLFVISAAVSTWFSVSPLTSWRGAVESGGGLQTILGYGALYGATRALCRTVADGWRLLTATVFATAVLCGHALLQIAGRDPIAWDGVSEFAGHVRPFATLAHANSLGAYLVMTLPLVAAFALRAAHERRWFALLTTTMLAIAAADVVFVTLSRAAWAGLAVGITLLVAGWCASSARRAGIALGAAVVLCVGLAIGGTASGWFGSSFSDSVRQRLAHVDDGSGRWEIWHSAWEMFRKRPLTGSGLDTFRLNFGAHRTAAYYRLEGDTTPAKAHNELLHVLATQGGLGAVAVLVLLGGLAIGGWRVWRRCAESDRPLVTAVLAGLAGFLVTDLTGFTVVGCGGLFVCCAALLSRWQEAQGAGCGRAVVGASLQLALPNPGQVANSSPPARVWPVLAGGLVVLLYVVNMGAAHVALALALGGGALACALPFCHGSQGRATLRAEGHRGGWLPHLALGAATLAVIVFNVVCPFLAGRACARGDRLLADDPAAARRHYEDAVAWDRDSDLYHVKLSAAAQLCTRQTDQGRDWQQGRRQLEQALALVPADPYHHANLARLLDEISYRDPAAPRRGCEEWDRALQLDPENIGFIAEAARGALATGNLARARRLAQRGLDLYADHALFAAQLGACWLAEGLLAEAAQWYETAVRGDWHGNADDEARAYAALASCHLGLGHLSRARDLARHASALQPRWPTAVLLLAQALEALGDSENALDAYRQVIAVAPDHPGARAGVRRLENRKRPGERGGQRPDS